MICILGCSVVLCSLIIALIFIKSMDGFLNYSMLKKVVTKKIPLWFPSDRKNESAYGPSLEQPNEGTYLPAFICCCVTYALSFILIIITISVHFCLLNKLVDKYIAIATAIICVMNLFVIRLLIEHYKKKYFKNQPYYIDKINDIINNKDID